MVHHDECPLCSSGELYLKYSCRDHFVSGEVFPLTECRNCGFIFTRDHPSENESSRYYESESYISHSNTSEGIINKLYLLVRKYMLGRKVKLVKNISAIEKGRLLDIGSGTGHFLSAMKNAGWQVKGIEVSKKARDYSISEFNLDIHESAGTVKDSFDCITLWHVMEHFHDPGSYMDKISDLLRPDGKCIIALPNSSSYDAAHFKEFWAAWDVPRHLWHFNKETFGYLAEKTGFNIVKVYSLPFDVFYISMLSEKYRGIKLYFVTGFLKGLYFALKSAISKNKSSSLVYIAKKK